AIDATRGAYVDAVSVRSVPAVLRGEVDRDPDVRYPFLGEHVPAVRGEPWLPEGRQLRIRVVLAEVCKRRPRMNEKARRFELARPRSGRLLLADVDRDPERASRHLSKADRLSLPIRLPRKPTSVN